MTHTLSTEILLPANRLSGAEYLGAWIDVVSELEKLKKHDLLHRNISSASFVFREAGVGTYDGILSDFDLTSYTPDTHAPGDSSPPCLRPTGTMPFLAQELFTRKTRVPHLLRHDIESAIYVLIWDAMRHVPPQNKGYKNKALWEWLDPKASAANKIGLRSRLSDSDLRPRKLEPFESSLFQAIDALSIGYAVVSSYLRKVGRTRAELNGEERKAWETMCGNFATDDIIEILRDMAASCTPKGCLEAKLPTT